MLRGAGVTSAQVAARLSPGYRAGKIYVSPVPASVTTNGAVAASTIYFYPIQIFSPVVIESMTLAVGTAVAATLVKAALYSNDPATGFPSALLAESTQEGDMNSVANTTIALALTATYTAAPGMYWGATKFNGVAQPYTNNVSAGGSGPVAPFYGQDSMRPYGNGGLSSAIQRFTLAQAYASAFPASAAGVAEGTGAPGAPIVGFLVD
jgi:hypothetical protein